MSSQDDFSPRTKRIVALRASHLCSFVGCQLPTAASSDESPVAVTMLGKAAHILGARRGSRRHFETMTSEQRSDISNAIWLCANHADLIDRDEATYTGDVLRDMKRSHEADRAARQRNAPLTGKSVDNLITIGPDVVLVGHFLGVESSAWVVHLQNFVEGDLHTLLRYVERYERAAAVDRYILVNSLGDGRVLKDSPSVNRRETGGYIVRCPVHPRADRSSGRFCVVGCSRSHGRKRFDRSRLRRRVACPRRSKRACRTKGVKVRSIRISRLAEYYRLLSESPFFAQLLKLELIRQAAIPYFDPIMKRNYTPLQCVERVFSIEVLAEAPANNWLPIRVDLTSKVWADGNTIYPSATAFGNSAAR
jgi:hypothetical protein